MQGCLAAGTPSRRVYRGRNRNRSFGAPEVSAVDVQRCSAATTTFLGSVGQRVAAATLALSVLVAQPSHALTTEQLLFLEAWRAVDRAYVDKSFNGQSWFKLREQYLKKEPMNDKEEVYAAIKKLLASLDDPFTRFLEPERYAQLKRGTSGSVTGVGVEVAFSQDKATLGKLLVVAPASGGPADRAGIRAQDAILAVDGQSTEGKNLYDVADLLQGEAGSKVVLKVLRRGASSPTDIELVRQNVTVPAVTSELCGPVAPSTGAPGSAKVGYIRLATFNKQTSQLFLEQFRALQDQGATAFVLDLRNNGGGYFPAGVQVARYLIDKGNIVLIADTKGVKDIYSSDISYEDAKSPLSVLVNGGTASAAEVLSGALQDNKRATIVGERTFGKGLIQSVVPLDAEDGSAVVVTVARYQTPNGDDINKRGIKPTLPLNTSDLPTDRVCKELAQDGAPKIFR